MRSIPQNLIRDKVYCVNYIEYLGENGSKAYFYIAVRQDEMSKFQAAIKQGNFAADDYGIILEQGEDSAPAHVRDKMKMMYNCEHANAVSVSDYVARDDNT